MGCPSRAARPLWLLALSAAVVSFFAAGCGGSAPSGVRPSPSPIQVARLADVGDFALLRGTPTRIRFELVTPQRVRVVVACRGRVEACSLWRVAGVDGTLQSPVRMPLEVGEPHGDGGEVIRWFGSPRLEPGFYRVDVSGRGRVLSLIVDRREDGG